MKLYLLLFLLAGIAGNGIAQAPDAAEIKNNKIKTITARYLIQGETDSMFTTYYYNENGHDTAYYENGARRYYNVIVYNKKLQPLTIEKFFPDGSQIDKTVFIYKTDGSSTSVNTDKQFGMKVTESYDKKGHEVSHSIPDGTIIKYVYNAKGQLTSTYSIPVHGEKKISSTYTYNAKGKIISAVNKGGFNSRSVYVYDAKGLLKKIISTSANESGSSSVSTTEYEYGF